MTVTARRAAPARPPALAWATLAIVGWTMIGWLALQLLATKPPSAAFDLELLLEAGRDVAAGRSPYDPALLGGTTPDATHLFFSYPPLVAQALAPFAAIPSGAMFAVWSFAAVAALAGVGELLRRLVRPSIGPATAGIAAVAVASLTFPFTVAILFGNLDAFFPALYGLALVAAVSPVPRDHLAGGIAVAVAALTKIYPAGLGLWFAIRGLRFDGRRSLTTVGAAVVAGLALLGVSLVVGGLEPWREYVRIAGVASGAELVDPRNVGPAAQVALLIGADSGVARGIHLAVGAGAVAVIAWAAWTRRDPVESLAIAAAATLLLLPVSWIHYPAAMIPFGAVAVMRAFGGPAGRRVWIFTAAAVAAGALALVWLPLLWVGVALCVAAVHASIAEPDPA
jgi:alpha-1,2-mannosyltransferase